jgi:hypothetical protein
MCCFRLGESVGVIVSVVLGGFEFEFTGLVFVGGVVFAERPVLRAGAFFALVVFLGGLLVFGVSLPVPPWPRTKAAPHAESIMTRTVIEGALVWKLFITIQFDSIRAASALRFVSQSMCICRPRNYLHCRGYHCQ